MSNDFANDPAAYPRKLQCAEREQELAKSRALCLEFGSVLQRLPRMKAEAEALLSLNQNLRYAAGSVGLKDPVARLELSLTQATAFLDELDALPVEMQRMIKDFIDVECGNLTFRSVGNVQQRLEAILIRATHELTCQQTSNGLYRIHDDGTVTDTYSNLMWKRVSEGGVYSWDKAIATFGNNVSFAGYHDWRMSTVDELKSIVNTAYSENFNPFVFAFANTIPECIIWSSSSPDSSSAWYVDFYDGSSDWDVKDEKFGVWLVRCAQ